MGASKKTHISCTSDAAHFTFKNLIYFFEKLGKRLKFKKMIFENKSAED
jgi:hypothetical protein